jgi:hypothetical protein
MRQVEINMVECVRNCCSRTLGNTEVFAFMAPLAGSGAVVLFGNTIAYFDELGVITLRDGGDRTATTKSRLNALLNDTGYRISQKKGQWRLFYHGKDRGLFENDTAFLTGSDA